MCTLTVEIKKAAWKGITDFPLHSEEKSVKIEVREYPTLA